MLQGNPFEAELVMHERTDSVRRGVAQQRAFAADRGKLQSWWETAAPSFSIRDLLARPREMLRFAWWLPAGIVVGVALSRLLAAEAFAGTEDVRRDRKQMLAAIALSGLLAR